MKEDEINNKFASLLMGFLWGAIVCLILTLLMGCRSIKYVPVETVKTEKVTVHDTVAIVDTVHVKDSTATVTQTSTILQKVDSAYMANLGIINAPSEVWLLHTNKDTRIESKSDTEQLHHEISNHISDSVRVEYRDRPYPVEKQLTRWQQFCLDYGKLTTGATVVLLFILAGLIIRKVKGKR